MIFRVINYAVVPRLDYNVVGGHEVHTPLLSKKLLANRLAPRCGRTTHVESGRENGGEHDHFAFSSSLSSLPFFPLLSSHRKRISMLGRREGGREDTERTDWRAAWGGATTAAAPYCSAMEAAPAL